jgi:hypothetical protein
MERFSRLDGMAWLTQVGRPGEAQMSISHSFNEEGEDSPIVTYHKKDHDVENLER